MIKLLSILFIFLIPSLLLADAGDLSTTIGEATVAVKQWGSDAMLLFVIVTVGFAIVTKWWCPRWLERARQNSFEAIGFSVFLYIIFYFFGDTIRDAIQENLNFWNWFGL